MNFKDEYKKEFSEISPDEAAAERIRKGVAEKLNEKAPKKPLFLRTTIIAAGSAAACLVIGVSALLLGSDSIKDSSNFAGATGGAGIMNNAENINTSANNNFMDADSAPTASSRPDAYGENMDVLITEGSGKEDQNDAGGAESVGGTGGANSVSDTDSVNSAGGAVNPDRADSTGGTKINGDEIADYPGENITNATEDDGSMTEPASETAKVTLDGEHLTLNYNGETTVFEVMFDYFETSEDIKDNAENSKRISVITDDGEKMTAVFLDDDIIALYNSDNVFLRRYIAIS